MTELETDLTRSTHLVISSPTSISYPFFPPNPTFEKPWNERMKIYRMAPLNQVSRFVLQSLLVSVLSATTKLAGQSLSPSNLSYSAGIEQITDGSAIVLQKLQLIKLLRLSNGNFYYVQHHQ